MNSKLFYLFLRHFVFIIYRRARLVLFLSSILLDQRLFFPFLSIFIRVLNAFFALFICLLRLWFRINKDFLLDELIRCVIGETFWYHLSFILSFLYGFRNLSRFFKYFLWVFRVLTFLRIDEERINTSIHLSCPSLCNLFSMLLSLLILYCLFLFFLLFWCLTHYFFEIFNV